MEPCGSKSYLFPPPLLFSYYKVTDPANWINVDKNTGQLRVANTIDRESKFVHDGIYNVTMKAVDARKFSARFSFHQLQFGKKSVFPLYSFSCWLGKDS